MREVAHWVQDYQRWNTHLDEFETYFKEGHGQKEGNDADESKEN